MFTFEIAMGALAIALGIAYFVLDNMDNDKK